MKWFNNLFKSSKKIEEKPKEFVFESLESAHIGDLYRYTVKADSEKEAFNKLVKMFFGKELNQPDVKSEHFTVSYPFHAKFEYKNMPKWFAKRISGHIKDKQTNYQQLLEKYCNENNIVLREN